MQITFNDMPSILAQLCEDVALIKSRECKISTDEKTVTKQWMNIDELCKYLPDKPAKATVYTWTHKNTIPHHKDKKKLRFLKSEIDLWLNDGLKMTIEETNGEVDKFLTDYNESNTK